ncbi:uncharacterized protein N0V89_003713 [Didymosphaeria variabile]|uniref:Uncharacterized protein n=1 Tax=Didymosphaeria variabile TaxID=1932322 RepID=A0A9W8XN51_9PLEO|nr:uncharacterized protein N0V89_003713 [Didymosphaeria variabile]KAJ4355693.1 hypothetical protein N0V89_003713 [Didymosphaeria variabile]
MALDGGWNRRVRELQPEPHQVPQGELQPFMKRQHSTGICVVCHRLDNFGRIASPHSPDTGRLFIAPESDHSAPEMDQVAQFVGYSASEFEEDSDHELRPSRSKAYRSYKPSPSNAPKSTPHARSIIGKSTADRVASKIKKGRPSASNTSKANPKKSKRTPLYQSSSSEDDQPAGGEEFADDEESYKPSSPPPQTSLQARQQAPPPASRQIPLQAPSDLRRVPPRATLQATGTKTLGSGLRARLQQAIARKGMSASSPQDQGNNIAKDRNPITREPAKETGQVFENTTGQLVGEAKLTNATTQASKLLPDDRPRAASSSAGTQRGSQKQTPPSFLRTQTQVSRAEAPRTTLVNRPPAYGPFNASQQRQTMRRKQPVFAPAPDQPDTSRTNSKGGVREEKPTTSSYPHIATSPGRSPPSDPAQVLFTPATTVPPSKTITPTNELQSALLGQPAPLSTTGRPATPARTIQMNLEGHPRARTKTSTPQTKPANLQSTTTKFAPANKPTQTKGTATKASNKNLKSSTPCDTTVTSDRPTIPVGGARPIHQHQKEAGSAPKSTPSKSNAADAKRDSVNKPAQIKGAASKPTSASPMDLQVPVHKSAAWTLQNILTEVSSGDATVEPVIGKGIEATKVPSTDNAVIPPRVMQKPPTSISTPSLSKHGPDTAQSNNASKAASRGTVSTPAPMPLTKARFRTDDAVARPQSGTGVGSDDKSESTVGHPTKNRSHEPVQVSLQPSTIQSSQLSTGQPRTTSPDSFKAPRPAGSKGPYSQFKAAAIPPAKPPTHAQAQILVPLQTKATASNQPQVSQQAPSRTPSSTAPRAPSATCAEPPASIEKPVNHAFDATTAATKQFTRTHVRVPSGPTEDGFDIYIPPAPGARKAATMSTPNTKVNVAAMPATPSHLSGEVSTIEKLPAVSTLPSLDDGKRSPLSAPTTASTTETEVSTSASVLRQDRPTAAPQAGVAGRSARTAAPSGKDVVPVPVIPAPVISQEPNQKDKPIVAPLVAKPRQATSTTIAKLNEVSHVRHCLQRSATEETSTLQAIPHACTYIAPQRVDERTDALAKLPEIVLRDRPKVDPPKEPYFEYRVKQKIWPESGTEQDAATMMVGFSSTVLETANMQAEELFTQAKQQYLSSFPIQHQQSSSGHTEKGCLELVGTLASIGWPVKQFHLKTRVERGEVPSDVAAFHPPPKFTPFLSKTLYMLRLYKLTEVPIEELDETDKDEGEIEDEEVKGDDEASVSVGGESSSDDSDEDASETDLDPDEGKHNKKRQAKEALKGSPPPKRRKTKSTSHKSIPLHRQTKLATPKRIIRQPDQIPCPEVYTSVDWANSAACNLQNEIINAKTPLSQAGRESNAARLRQKLMALGDKDGEERYWHNEFVIGLGGDKMEIIVEPICVCGPRNV